MQQYLKYNSVINIKFTSNVINSLPAITICYNRLYSFEKLWQRHHGFEDDQDVYENYIKFTNEFNGKYKLDSNFSEYIKEKNQFYIQKYQDLLAHFKFNNPGVLFSYEYKFHDIFDNLTIPLEDSTLIEKYRYNNRSIVLTVYGYRGNISGFYYQDNKASDLPRTSGLNLKPIESIDLYRNSKCFTFFDETQIPFTKNILNLKSIQIRVEFPKTWFPFDKDIGISLAIHSPNIIPGRHSFDKLTQNSNYNNYFSKIEDIRLENYDNCINRGDILNESNTRNYCLDKCFESYIGYECIAIYNLLNKKQSLRRNQLPITFTLDWDLWTNCWKLISKIEQSRSCTTMCKEDCYQAHYFVDNEEEANIITNLRNQNPISTTNNDITLTLQPNGRPNIIIEHFAEMTLLSLICNFGGLVGMYLGISLQVVTYQICHIIKEILIKYFFNRNNSTIINQQILFRPNIIINSLIS